MKDFPIDVDKPGYVVEILHSILSNQISFQCKEWGIAIPAELQAFCQKNDPESGLSWEIRIMELAETMTIEQLEAWVNALRRGLCRAEMRAVLKRRKGLDKGGGCDRIKT